jgi:hypothetical protein
MASDQSVATETTPACSQRAWAIAGLCFALSACAGAPKRPTVGFELIPAVVKTEQSVPNQMVASENLELSRTQIRTEQLQRQLRQYEAAIQMLSNQLLEYEQRDKLKPAKRQKQATVAQVFEPMSDKSRKKTTASNAPTISPTASEGSKPSAPDIVKVRFVYGSLRLVEGSSGVLKRAVQSPKGAMQVAAKSSTDLYLVETPSGGSPTSSRLIEARANIVVNKLKSLGVSDERIRIVQKEWWLPDPTPLSQTDFGKVLTVRKAKA